MKTYPSFLIDVIGCLSPNCIKKKAKSCKGKSTHVEIFEEKNTTKKEKKKFETLATS